LTTTIKAAIENYDSLRERINNLAKKHTLPSAQNFTRSVRQAIDNNATQISDTKIKIEAKKAITAQETEFQSHLTPRLQNLINTQNNIRHKLEAG